MSCRVLYTIPPPFASGNCDSGNCAAQIARCHGRATLRRNMPHVDTASRGHGKAGRDSKPRAQQTSAWQGVSAARRVRRMRSAKRKGSAGGMRIPPSRPRRRRARRLAPPNSRTSTSIIVHEFGIIMQLPKQHPLFFGTCIANRDKLVRKCRELHVRHYLAASSDAVATQREET